MNNEKMKVIQRGIRVDYLLNEVMSIPDQEWKRHAKNNAHKILPLTVSAVYDGKSPLESTDTVNTPFYYRCPQVVNWLRRNKFQHHSWAGIFMLPPGGLVPWHTDDAGAYYIGKMRYHLCLQGEYTYKVKEEDGTILEEHITPGTFFRFDLFSPHQAECVSTNDRITLLFDLPTFEQLNNP
jgi:Aspartyl/Asparaginyl beta-hydroxylase